MIGKLLLYYTVLFGPVVLDFIIIAMLLIRAIVMGKKLRNLSEIVERFLRENGKDHLV